MLGHATMEDLYACVERAQLTEVDELLDRVQLSHSDFDHLALSETQLAQRIAQFVTGKLRFWDLSDWVLQLYRIFASVEYRKSRHYSPRVDRAMMLLALAVDLDLTESVDNSHKLCARIMGAIERGHALPCETILRQLFRGKAELHFITTAIVDPETDDGALPSLSGEWLDIALVSSHNTIATQRNAVASSLDLPFSNEVDTAGAPGAKTPTENHGWFIPIAVCTQRFFEETRPDGAWCHSENDKIHELRDRYGSRPLFGSLEESIELLQFSTPHYYVDPDGLVEVVLDVESIGPYEAESAVKLFCLRNGITRGCYLDDVSVIPVKEDL